jgi:hypothetical protein
MLGFLKLTSLASAQTTPDVDLELEPASTYVWVKPGQTKTLTLNLTQHGSIPLVVTPKVVDFHPDDTSGQPVLSSVSRFPHFKLNTPTLLDQPIKLSPKKTVQIMLTISPPADTLPGEYLQTLLFESVADQDQSLSGVGTKATAIIGSNFIIAVSPEAPVPGQLKIKKVSAPRLVDSLGKITITALASNPNRYAVIASGTATLTNWQGRQVAEYPLANLNVLGFSTRPLQPTKPADPDSLFPSFEYDAPFLIGQYTFTLTLVDPKTGVVANTYTQTILALPITLALALVIFVLTFVMILILKRQNYPLASWLKRVNF